MDSRLNIIVVEDNEDLREATIEALQTQGHAVRGADCGEALDELNARFDADLLILDLNLPGEDGLSIARRLRQAAPELGIIMVTARSHPDDLSGGYGQGADIYLVKPASLQTLEAAVQALGRRLRPTATTELVLKPNTRQLIGPGGIVELSSLEYTLLSGLALALDHVLEYWQLIELSGKKSEPAAKGALEVQIVRLRKKLEQAGAAPPTIKAIRGTGYQLCVPVSIRKQHT